MDETMRVVGQLRQTRSDCAHQVVLVSDGITPEPPEPLVAILSTAESLEAAKKIALALVTDKLVACVNLLPGVVSIYEWEGKIEEAQEIAMIMKTRKSLVVAVTEAVKSLHSYSVPEVIALDLVGGNNAYLEWVVGNTAHPKASNTLNAAQSSPVLPSCDAAGDIAAADNTYS